MLFEETCRWAGDVDVASAASGAEALDVAREFRPDVLVLDLHLPDTTGYALLGALRGAAGRPDTPAFLCTADEPALVAASARAAGFDGCWSKPVDVKALLAELERLGGRNGAAG